MVAGIALAAFLGSLAFTTEGGSGCPIRLHASLAKPTFTYWEIVSGSITVSSDAVAVVPATFEVKLFREGALYFTRQISLDVRPGRATYDVADALGVAPAAQPSLLGRWRLSVEMRSGSCRASTEATFRIAEAAPRAVRALSGLVGYWSFDERSGRRAVDWSGGGRDAALVGTQWEPGRFRGAVGFDGRSSVVRLPWPLSSGDRMTLIVWLRPDASGPPVQQLLAWSASGGAPTQRVSLVLRAGEPKLELAGADGRSRVVPFGPGSRALPDGRWSHLALSRDGDTLAVYLDGQAVGSATTPLPRWGSEAAVGGGSERGAAPFKGGVDDLRLFARTLSAEELRADYAAAGPAAADITVTVDTQNPIGPISPLIYGVNVEGPERFSLSPVLGITSVRWPGGCFAEGYHWRDAVGPQRPPGRTSFCEGDQPSTPPRSLDVGADEFMAVLRRAGATPHITLNFTTGTAQEAANWVEYMNGEGPGLEEGVRRGWTATAYRGGDRAPKGYFAWLRRHFGNPTPYGVRYWAVGNEFEERTTPSWTRDVAQYYRGGIGKVTGQFLTRDPARVDWSSERRTSADASSRQWFALFTPAVPGSQRVAVGPALNRQPLPAGAAEPWRYVQTLTTAGRENVYEFSPSEASVTFGDGRRGNAVPPGSTVRLSYESGPHDGFIEFARRIKAVDPAVRVGSAATSGIPVDAAPHVDFVAVNMYPRVSSNAPDAIERHYRFQAASLELAQKIAATQEDLRRRFPDRQIELAVTEYNANLQSPHLASVSSALFLADMLRIFADKKVPIANYYSLHSLTSGGSGTGEPTPVGLTFQFYREHFGETLVALTTTNTPSFVGTLDGRRVSFPYVEVAAAKDSRRGLVTLMAINKHVEQSFPVAVSVAPRRDLRAGRTFTMTAEHFFAASAIVRESEVSVRDGVVRFLLPPHSLVAVELRPVAGP